MTILDRFHHIRYNMLWSSSGRRSFFALKKTRASGRNVGKVFNPVVKLVLENQPFLIGTLIWLAATIESILAMEANSPASACPDMTAAVYLPEAKRPATPYTLLWVTAARTGGEGEWKRRKQNGSKIRIH